MIKHNDMVPKTTKQQEHNKPSHIKRTEMSTDAKDILTYIHMWNIMCYCTMDLTRCQLTT